MVVLQGFMLFTRWLVGGGGRHARGAEQAFPAAAVAVHGAVAVTTVVLVFLTAIQVTRASGSRRRTRRARSVRGRCRGP